MSGPESSLPDWPDDAVEVAVVTGAWGIKGGLRLKPFSSDPQSLFSTKRWYWQFPEAVAPAQRECLSRLEQPLRVASVREQGDGVVALIQDLTDRDVAQACRGLRLFVRRSSFPTAAEGEYYWVDLVGLEVFNRQGQCLGRVAGLMQTGPHSVLRIESEARASGKSVERLVPFVDAYVDSVDLQAKRIEVDWDLDD
ncbi:MAG: ribosome maturation factor RimM [Betaproteobacteria bacterium]|nr:ribosome maturation factor RimM [Betaproteobacteria bacterium]NBT10110.1 ribosome maturation factor RimM [Betaproteobacteria bacterium]NBU48970.1 ribosome maturation factor RimM [Betaproteobacteria bacterium]NBX96313.1 ribosome maturation factor RimM [Betaproteobacteria bacterium]